MAEKLADLLANAPHQSPRRAKPSHPTGWEPHVEEAGPTATVVTHPVEGNPDHRTLLSDSGLDPDLWVIDSDVQVRRWQQTPGGEWLRYFRFTASRGTPSDVDVDALCRKISRHRSTPKPALTDITRVVAIADTQAGKGEGGGTEALLDRWLAAADGITALLREERPAHLIVAGMGDLVEGCGNNWYAMQDFQLDLDRRQQAKFVRRMLVKNLTAWAPLVPKVTVACVPGNHGENRRGGKAYTSWGDNDDVAVFEQVKEILAANQDSYGHIRFVIPDDELVVTLQDGENILALAHGHQFSRGANPAAKAGAWWSGQAMGNRPAGDANVLVSGHYHHVTYAELSRGREWLQCPSLDGGSAWFTQSTGKDASPGILTFTLGETGVDHVRVVR